MDKTQLRKKLEELYPGQVKVIELELDPVIHKEVCDFIRRIEEAHKRAANSKLHFRGIV